MMKQPAEILEGVGDALQEMGFTFEETAKTVSAEGLHDADINVGIVVAEERFAIERDETGKTIEIMIEKLLAEVGGQIGFGVEQKRGDVILESAFAAALVVHEEWIAFAQHDVAGLKVAVKKIIARRTEQEFGETAEIVFESLFVERNAGEAEEIVLEIVQVPGNGLAVETGIWIADGIVEVAASLDLETREDGHDFAVGFDHFWSDALATAILGEKLEKGGVAEVFFEIGTVGEVFCVNIRNREAMAAKMSGEFKEGGVFFAHAVEDADGADSCVGQTDDFAAGTTELALERDDALGRSVKMVLEELLENVQGHGFPSDS